MSDLERATVKLYDSFRCYPLKPKLDTCPHCELDAAERALHARPLREMTWEDFGVYPFKAMTTFGDVEDFKHFLPQILELCVLDYDGMRYDVDVVLWKLKDADWISWPESEIRAVREYVECWVQNFVAREQEAGEESWQLEELRAALAAFGFSVGGGV